MARLPPIAPSELDDAQRRVVEAALAGRRRYLPAPLHAWLCNPAMAMPAQALGEAIRFDLHLAPAVTAVAALTVATWWKAGYVQGVQAEKLRSESVAEAVIEAIMAGEVPVLAEPAQAAAYHTTAKLLQSSGLDDDAYAKAVAVLGDQGMVELVAAIGYYTLVSLTVVTFDISARDETA